MSTQDANGALHQEPGATDGGEFAKKLLKEPAADAIGSRIVRTSPLPSEILAAASEQDIERLESKYAKARMNGVESVGIEMFDRTFRDLEAYEQEHGTWAFEARPEWFTTNVSSLMIDPSVGVPRERGSGLELHNSVAAVCLYGRFGGGNRECYCDENEIGSCTGCLGDALAGKPGYITDEDDEDDSTYANAYFTIADEEKRAEATRILTINSLADAAHARDALVAGAPIWTLGETPRTYSYRQMVDIRRYQTAVAASARAKEALDKFDAGHILDEATLAEAFAGSPKLRLQNLGQAIGAHDRVVVSIAIEENRIAELNAPLAIPGLLTGEPERLVRESLDRATAKSAGLQSQQKDAVAKIRSAIALMAIPAEFQNYQSYDEKKNFQESVWALPGQKIPADFRATDYFRRQMTDKVKNSTGFDTLDDTQQTALLDWSVKP